MGTPRLEATIDRFEGDFAILKIVDGQELLWPAGDLPDGAVEGSVVNLLLQTNEEATQNERDRAKAILNEILHAE